MPRRKVKKRNKILFLATILILLAILLIFLAFSLKPKQIKAGNETQNVTNYTFVNENINITVPPGVIDIGTRRITVVK